MSGKYTLASSTTAGDRLLNVGMAARQLSTGDLVELAYDPAAADPGKITLQLVTAHTTPSVIATLNAAAAGALFSLANPRPQTLSLCRDKFDNLYAFGPYGGSTPGLLAYQAFKKQSGSLTWSIATGNAQGSATPAYTIMGTSATWCDTGGGAGGAGHLVVLVNYNINQSACFILDAGLVLAGAGAITQVTTNPYFLGQGVPATCGTNLDLAQDSFGATSGFAVAAGDAADIWYGGWGVTSSGRLVTGSGVVQGPASGALSATTKLRIVRVAPGLWAVVYPSATHAGQLSITSFSATTGFIATADSGTAGSFPTPSATLSWDAVMSDPSTGTLWIYAWSSATATTMLRLPVTFPAGIPTVGAAVSDDTAVGSGAGNTTIRIARSITDFAHVDWQTNDVVTPFALIGDYSSLPVPPSAPVLVAPANNSALPLASGGTLTWNDVFPLRGDVQVSYALRRRLAGGLYQWWTGSAFTATQSAPTGGNEIYVTNAVSAVTFGAALWTGSAVYLWSVSVTGTSGAGYPSPYSPEFQVTVLAQPATPTLTATYNSGLNANVLVAQGSTATAPTGSIEYSDDAGVTWQFVRGATAFTIYPGPVTFYDYAVDTTVTRQYRARCWSTLPLNYSLYVQPAGVAPPVTSSFYLIDQQTGTAIPVLIKAGSPGTTRNVPGTVHQPIGASFDIVVSDTPRARPITVTFVTTNVSDMDALDDLLDLGRALFYQSPIDESVWVQCTAAATIDVPVVDAPWLTYHEHAVTFTTVGRPAP